ncbi:MAG: GH-E family nuclease [Spirosomataceae bacterium]
MKTTAEKSSSASSPAKTFSKGAFFASAGKGSFFAPSAQVSFSGNLSSVKALAYQTTAFNRTGIPATDKAATAQSKSNDPGTSLAEAPAEARPAVKLKKAPVLPKDDPAFQQAVTHIKRTGKNQRKHPEPEAKKLQVKGAAVLPIGEQKLYNDRKTHLESINQTASKEKGKKRFSAAVFKTLLNAELAQLEKQLPHSESDAKKFKRDKPLEKVREGISGKVNEENQKVAAPITSETVQPSPPDSGIEPQEAGTLAKDALGGRPRPMDPAAAVPKPKQEEEISMEKKSRGLDELMAESKLTDEQLANSNEPNFIRALDTKKEAQKKAAAVPVQYRTQETAVLTRSQNGARMTENKEVNAMIGQRDNAFTGVLGKQTSTKSADVTEQNRIKGELKRIYDATKTDVNKIFTDLTTNEQSATNVNKIFNDKSTTAKERFEKRVEDQLDDIHGLGIKDFFFGEDTEAIEGVFTREKAIFLSAMDTVLDEISGIIAEQLNAAIDRIQKGRDEAEGFYASLSKEQQRLAGEAMEQYRVQYSDLEASVNDKQTELVSSLAAAYKESADSLRATFDKLEEEASKNFLQKAADFVVGIAKAVYNLGKLLISIVTRIANIIDEILAHPIRFLENLGAGIKQGFATFVDNFDSYLLKGFFDWLRGSMSGSGIQLPASLDEKGLFGLAIQLIGLNYETFREVVVRKLGAGGERILAVLEKGEEMLGEATALFQILKTEGIGGLWTHLKEMMLSHLTEIFDRIKETVLYETIKKALVFVASMFNPIGAFIKAVQALYAGLKFLIDNIERIAILVNSFLDSLEMAVKGNVSGIANKIITALSTFIVMAIDFLAKLLGLGNLAEKVRKIIQAFRNPVVRAMEWLVDKVIKPVVNKILGAGKAVLQAGLPVDPNERLKLGMDTALKVVNRLPGNFIGKAVILPVLTPIKLRYGFQLLEPVLQDGKWWLRGHINPSITVETGKKAGTADSKITFKVGDWVKSTYIEGMWVAQITTISEKNVTIWYDDNRKGREIIERDQFAEYVKQGHITEYDYDKTNREKYMGSNISRSDLLAHYRNEGTHYRKNGNVEEVQFPKQKFGKWYDYNDCDASHEPKDAVTYWNETGRKHGALSTQVRNWMTNPKNYVFEPSGPNRSRGSRKGEFYKPPLK